MTSGLIPPVMKAWGELWKTTNKEKNTLLII